MSIEPRFLVVGMRFRDPYSPSAVFGVQNITFPRDLLTNLFFGPFDWSMQGYWRRVTAGLVVPQFEFVGTGGFHIVNYTHASIADDRGAMIAAASTFAREQGYDPVRYDGVIAFHTSPGSNIGASGPNAALDIAGTLPVYQHEVGHVMGFQHSFPLYTDPFDVMAASGVNSRHVEPPAQFAQTPLWRPDFWRCERAVAAANLWRRLWGTQLFENGRNVRRIRSGDRVWLKSFSDFHSNFNTAEPALAVVELGGNRFGTIELRTKSGFDAGLPEDSVVAHSIGDRSLAPGQTEDRPIWYEGAVRAAAGHLLRVNSASSSWSVNVHRTVADDQGRVQRAEVSIG